MRKIQWINKLEEKIEKYDVITFDIFDTLIKRDCLNSRNVFDIVEEKCNTKLGYETDFSKKRFQSEVELYQKGNLTPTLKEIYENLKLNCTVKDTCIEIEENTEIVMACANKSIYSIYLKCKALDKKIFAISDMYLSNTIISKILNKCGYEIDNVLISSEEKANKTSGELFEKFLGIANIDSKSVLHIGDNYKADILGSKKKNIASFLIPKNIKNACYYTKNTFPKLWEDRNLYPFVNNHLPFIKNRRSQIAYETLGPLIYGYCQWLHRVKKDRNISKLLFCARDVYQTLKIYRELYPDEYAQTEYLCISLRSLKRPYESACGKDKSNEAKEQLLLIREYLSSLGCKGKIAMVDSGYGGHTQHMLKTILGDTCELQGFYMRMSKNFTKKAKSEAAAYMYNDKPSARSYISGAFFETMLGATHGRTQGYEKNDLGQIIPIFGDGNPEANVIEEFQKGIDYFVEQWHHLDRGVHKIASSAIQDSFLNFSFYPLKSDVELLQGVTGGNESYDGIVLKKNISLFKTPIAYMKALRDTYWKGGFLCVTIKRYKLFSRIYLFADEIILNIVGF